MKHFKLILWTSVLVAACLPAQAQDFGRFKVPFDFTARGTHFSAGEYVVSKALSGSDTAWIVRNIVTGEASIIPTNSIKSPLAIRKISLVFHSNEGHYSLYEFWSDGHNGRVLQPSHSDAQYSQTERASLMTVVEIPATSGN